MARSHWLEVRAAYPVKNQNRCFQIEMPKKHEEIKEPNECVYAEEWFKRHDIYNVKTEAREFHKKHAYRCSKCGSSKTHIVNGKQKSTNKTSVIISRKGIKCEVCGFLKDILPNEAPLKPWHDPESLFCDTEFLKQLINKDPAPGDECKGSKI